MFRSKKTFAHFHGVFDEGYKDLLKMTKQQPKIIKRAKTQIFTYYQNVNKQGVIEFLTPSGTRPGKFFIQKIELVDLKSIIKKYGTKKKPLQLVRLAMQGNIKISCNCESWGYWGHQYKATISGYNYGKSEKRFPEIRNPQLKGGGCKHLRAVLESLSFHAGVITRDLKKLGVFPE